MGGNNNYQCQCSNCFTVFQGHKRQVICHKCRRKNMPEAERKLIDIVATAIEPGAFEGTPESIHMYCSPTHVDFFQEQIRLKAERVLKAIAKELQK